MCHFCHSVCHICHASLCYISPYQLWHAFGYILNEGGRQNKSPQKLTVK